MLCVFNPLQRSPNERAAQKALAQAATTIVHGPKPTVSVQKVTDVLFGEARFSELSFDDIDILTTQIPTVALGSTVIEALVKSGIASSNGEARRLLEANAVSVNGEKITNDTKIESQSLIKKGKNNFVLVR